MQRADIAAANSNFINYANGNVASLALIDESIRSDPGIYPPPELKAKLIAEVSESEPFSRLPNRSWNRFVTGK
jgi:putrescine transport system substrate-binding protein